MDAPITKTKCDFARLADYRDVDFRRISRLALLSRMTEKDAVDSQFGISNPLDRIYRSYDVLDDNGLEHCRIFENNDEIILAFEGSDPTNDLQTKRNLEYGRRVPLTEWKVWGYKIVGEPEMVPSPTGGNSRIHPGFARSIFGKNDISQQNNCDHLAGKVMDRVNTLLKEQPNRRVSLTGHSAGGALAGMMGAYLTKYHPEIERGDLYIYGSPRFGGKHFIAGLEKAFPGTFIRCELYGDPVPAWPRYEPEYYIHGGRQIVLSREGGLLPGCDESGHRNDSYARPFDGVLEIIKIKMGANRLGFDPIAQSRRYHTMDNYVSALNTFLRSTEPRTPHLEDLSTEVPSPVVSHPTLDMTGIIKDSTRDLAANKVYWWSDYALKRLPSYIDSSTCSEEDKTALHGLLNELHENNINRAGLDKHMQIEHAADILAMLYLEFQVRAPLPDDTRKRFEDGLLALSHYLSKSNSIDSSNSR